MKKIILIAAIICTFGFSASAQKYAFVNTDYILGNIPEYADAQTQLDELSIQWQKEIEVKFAEIDKMYKSFQNEAVLLPEDMKKKREDDIIKNTQNDILMVAAAGAGGAILGLSTLSFYDNAYEFEQRTRGSQTKVHSAWRYSFFLFALCSTS